MELVSTTPATCTIGEIQHYKCSVCGETKDVTLSNPLGEHSWITERLQKKLPARKMEKRLIPVLSAIRQKRKVIPATGHQHKEVRNAKESYMYRRWLYRRYLL